MHTRIECWLMPGAPTVHPRSRTRSVVLLVVALLFAQACDRTPSPPDPAALEDVDPEVKALIVEHTAAVNASRSDPARWGRLGMAYEANGLLV